MGSRPVNALTLDEIHARENIHPMNEPSDRASDDLGAFNKLVAVLQSSGDIRNEKGSPPSSSSVERPPRQQNQLVHPQPTRAPPHTTAPTALTPGEERRVSPQSESSNTSFGFLLEKELGFDDESSPVKEQPIPAPAPMLAPYQRPTPAPPLQREYPPRPPPPPQANVMGRGEPPGPSQPSMSRLEAIAGMLEKLDRSHLQTASYSDVPTHPSPIPPPAPNMMTNKIRHEQQQQQQLAMLMERERETQRNWRYPEPFMDPSRPSPPVELLRSMPPPPRQLPGVGGRIAGPPSSSRPSSNHWAIEIERRRVFELRQMRERERMFQQQQQQQQHIMSPSAQAKVCMLCV